jgi:putative flavoprotein involved in K+ transport
METLKDKWDVVIIGGGQAGLATGYFLKRMKREFIILDDNSRSGDSWRKRWDSLMLFTPAKHDSLPGLPFPGSNSNFPGKDDMADYLEQYERKFSLPVRHDTRVNHVVSENDHFEIETNDGKIIADNVVVATGTNPFPRVPAFSSGLSKDIFQIHSSVYINSDSIPPGDVLVVGAATSGIEIALELSRTRKTYISGTSPFHIPDNLLKYGGELYWWFINNILTIKTPAGKKVKEKILHGGSPLIRISRRDLDNAGVKSLPRVKGTNDGYPLFEDNSTLKVKTIIWATGYRPDFSWIDGRVTGETGWPLTTRGISLLKNGLYFVGMPFQFGLTSGLVGGVGRDAGFVARHIRQN